MEGVRSVKCDQETQTDSRDDVVAPWTGSTCVAKADVEILQQRYHGRWRGNGEELDLSHSLVWK